MSQELSEIKQLSEKLTVFINNQTDHNTAMSLKVDLISRAVHGEEENNALGLVKQYAKYEMDIKQLKKDMHEVKGFKKRLMIAGGILVAALEGLWHWITDIF